jgi:drug/metabolite transporter (DMT)-like permease
MGKYHPITVLKWAYLFGAIIVLPLGFNEFTQISWTTMPVQAILSIAYVVVFSSFVAFVLNVYSLTHISPTVVSSYVYSQPAIATGFALLVGSDHLTWVKVLSASLVFIGVYLASVPEREEVVRC